MAESLMKPIDETTVDTVLADDIEFEGTLTFDQSVMIKGRFTGSIDARGQLYVGPKAEVEASLRASMVSIRGRVVGDVEAYEKVELAATAQVIGDITAPDVVMESGCRFNGVCAMKSPGERKEI